MDGQNPDIACHLNLAVVGHTKKHGRISAHVFSYIASLISR